MVGLSSIVNDRRTRFANRFERTGDGYVYRPDPASAGLHVSVGEHDAFIRRYNTSLDLSFLGVAAGMFGVLELVIKTMPDPSSPWLPLFALGFGLIAVFACFEAYDFWSHRAPARSMAARLG